MAPLRAQTGSSVGDPAGASAPTTRLRPRHVPEFRPAPLVVTPGPLLWLTTIADRAVLGLGDRVLDLPAEVIRS